MQPEEAFRAAEARASELKVARGARDAELDRLRQDAARLFGQLPEPPLYRRPDDPVRGTAGVLIPEATELLARELALERMGPLPDPLAPLGPALRACLEALCHTEAGRLGQAEEAWTYATELERQALSARRLLMRTGGQPQKVFDRATGVSRYDPAPEAMVHVKLACPNPRCQQIGEFAFSPRHSTHQFQCPSCRLPFIAYFGEVRSLSCEERPNRVKHYLYRLEELSGGLSRVEFEDASGAELPCARQDLIAFLYSPERELRGVLNLSTSRLLWIRRGGPCFVAAVAFGEGAPELEAFRAFRDDVLRRTGAGAFLVGEYYRRGPALARIVFARPWLRALARRALLWIHRRLVRRR